MAKDENGIKVCKNCGSKGPFNKGSNKKDHLSSYCVPCDKARGILHYRKYRQMTLDLLGGKCAICGFDDPRALQVDHINGGGNQERIALKNPNAYRLYKLVEADVNHEKYQVLCANHNMIKRIENGEH